MNALDIMRKFHALDMTERVAVMSEMDGEVVDNPSPFAKEIAEITEAERAEVLMAISHDFGSNGSMNAMGKLSTVVFMEYVRRAKKERRESKEFR